MCELMGSKVVSSLNCVGFLKPCSQSNDGSLALLELLLRIGKLCLLDLHTPGHTQHQFKVVSESQAIYLELFRLSLLEQCCEVIQFVLQVSKLCILCLQSVLMVNVRLHEGILWAKS